MSLESIDLLNSQIVELDEQIRQLVDPMLREVKQIITIPGVKDTATRVIVSEIGIDMSHFGSPGRLCAWSGLAPGNRETAGKRKSSRTPKGNRYLRRVLVQCAWAARKTNSYLGNTFLRLEKRIGCKKAAIAVARKILVIIYDSVDLCICYNWH
ncbi:MAG: transposase [Candidatus Hermodarchaeota archaeon]